MLRRMQACKHLNNAVRFPMSSQAEKTVCVRYVAGFFCLATPRISAIPSHMLTGLHPARHIPPTLAPLRPASHPLRRVPVRLCEIKRSHVRRPVLHSMFAARRGRQNRRAGLYVSVESLGRSSVAGGGSLFPPCLRPFPPCGAQSPSLVPRTRRPPSSERANAHPTGVRASGGRARPATLFNCAGFPHPCAFPPLRGSLRSPLRKRLPAPLWAPLRSAHATQARERGI
jgi:hypothetical protein